MKREEVVRGLERFINDYKRYINHADYQRVYNALDLLKEQEPRVIKEGELYRFQCKDVWIEKILSNFQHIVYAATLAVVSECCIFHGMVYDEIIKDYNVECVYGWRCWTARPTEEQMRETPWEEVRRET